MRTPAGQLCASSATAWPAAAVTQSPPGYRLARPAHHRTCLTWAHPPATSALHANQHANDEQGQLCTDRLEQFVERLHVIMHRFSVRHARELEF